MFASLGPTTNPLGMQKNLGQLLPADPHFSELSMEQSKHWAPLEGRAEQHQDFGLGLYLMVVLFLFFFVLLCWVGGMQVGPSQRCLACDAPSRRTEHCPREMLAPMWGPQKGCKDI